MSHAASRPAPRTGPGPGCRACSAPFRQRSPLPWLDTARRVPPFAAALGAHATRRTVGQGSPGPAQKQTTLARFAGGERGSTARLESTVPKKQSTAAQRAREAARQSGKYTRALRTAEGTAPVDAEPADGFGGHEFEYESSTDLFCCTECRVYELVARDTDGPIKPCTGLVGYGGDTERVYLLLTEHPDLPYRHAAFLARKVRSTGIGRPPQFSWRNGKLLVESAPSVVAELVRRVELITSTIEGRQVPAVASVDRLTAEAGRALLAENYAAYIAEYGEPA